MDTISNKKNEENIVEEINKNEENGTVGVTSNTDPFRTSHTITRSPPNKSGGVHVGTDKNKGEVEHDALHLSQIKQNEEKAFIDLGRKINSVNKVLETARNIHKSIRDDITCAMAIYEQMKEIREAISCHTGAGAISAAKVVAQSKAVQVDIQTPSTSNQNQVNRSKRLQSMSPNHDRAPKRLITVNTTRTTETCPADTVPAMAADLDRREDAKPVEDNNWETVQHRKRKRKRAPINRKQNPTRDPGEAITIKAQPETYAEVIKKMKSSVNPSEIGVEISSMKRTKAGELIVKFKKGVGQAEKLKDALSNTLGDDVTIRSVARIQMVDIRDLDESTDKEELKDALIRATGIQLDGTFKILNLREAYGKTKQALVQMPANIATNLLKERKIKVGWVRCRLRAKTPPTTCFRCLDRGHRARECKGDDRSKLCRNCCHSGHIAKECKQKRRCIICQDAGLQRTDHFIGSAICVENRRELSTR